MAERTAADRRAVEPAPGAGAAEPSRRAVAGPVGLGPRGPLDRRARRARREDPRSALALDLADRRARRAPAVRARAVAVPDARADGGPAGAHPASRDRAGGGGGVGRAGAVVGRGPARPRTQWPAPVCVDLGTGSGAIALSLAVEGRGASALASRCGPPIVSAEALAVAAANLTELGGVDPDAAARVRLAEGSWFDALPAELAGRVDLVVSNPPYVAEDEYPGLDPAVRDWEPRGALVAARGSGGVAGMAAIEADRGRAPTLAAAHRRPGGRDRPVPGRRRRSAPARRAGFDHVRTERDLAGRLRMLVAR